MSGFIKRERALKSVNPAGGINPASTPNVGQYGWTSYDSAIVNQLIGYAELAKDSADAAKEYADYIQDQIADIDEATLLLVERLEEFDPKYQDFVVKYPNFERIYNNTVSLHEAVVLYHEEVVKLSAQVYNDSVIAKGWAYMSYIIYLDSRGELVNKGNWDATSKVLPPVPTTNSIWTVNTGGQVDVDFGGFIWNQDDHLVYTLREKKFNQIKKSFYTFTTKGVNVMETIAEMQREISELKEKLNGHVF